MALLRLIKGFSPGKTFLLGENAVTLGRSHECEILLEVPSVSRKHARIFYRGGKHFLEDLGSRNGTLVNNIPIHETVELHNRDRIQVCSIIISFMEDGHENDSEDSTDFQAQMVDDVEDSQQSSYMATFDMFKNHNQMGMTTVKAEDKLKALIAIGRHLGEVVTLEEVLLHILESLFDIFPQADRGIIVLRDPVTGRLQPKALKQRNPDNEEVRLSRTILQNVISSGHAILSADAANDSRFDMAVSIVSSPIRSMMCAPLIGIDGTAIGVLQLDASTTMRKFTANDLELLASVANQAAIAVQNAQLMERAMEEASLRRELSVAHTVQQGLLPAARPFLNGFEFFDYYAPAKMLGGDYYDYVPLGNGNLACTLADVSGKGISASLLMAKLSAENRYNLALNTELSDAIFYLNNTFCDQRWDDRFVTLVTAILQPLSGEVKIVNAGHVPPIIVKKDGTVQVKDDIIGGLPVGVIENSEYEEVTLTLEPGDSLFMFTDGVTDAINEKAEMFGLNRVLYCWSTPFTSIQQQGMALIRDIQRFVGTVPNADDICVLGIRRTE
ncbi:MAG: SpoIIE family protein phosphatase [Planctomycetia bacterium]|nr:SpoIIE family protein phosphatase [Planctomycetia bacterium]